jgi:hypothetical protein
MGIGKKRRSPSFFLILTQFRKTEKALWKGVENASHFFLSVENFFLKSTRFRTFALKTRDLARVLPKSTKKQGQRNCVETDFPTKKSTTDFCRLRRERFFL